MAVGYEKKLDNEIAMTKAYTYKLKLRPSQENALNATLSACCWLYNTALEEKNNAERPIKIFKLKSSFEAIEEAAQELAAFEAEHAQEAVEYVFCLVKRIQGGEEHHSSADQKKILGKLNAEAGKDRHFKACIKMAEKIVSADQEQMNIESEIRDLAFYELKHGEAAVELVMEQARFLDSLDEKGQNEEIKRMRAEVNLAAQKEKWKQKKIREVNPSLPQMCSQVIQMVLQRLDQSFQNFFKRVARGSGAPGYPKYKKTADFATIPFSNHTAGWRFILPSEEQTKDPNAITTPRLKLNVIGSLKMHYYRPIPEGANIRTLSISKGVNGWTAQITIQVLRPQEAKDKPGVGIDVGLKEMLTTSDGEVVSPMKFYRKSEDELAELGRKIAAKDGEKITVISEPWGLRKVRGSRKYRELLVQLQKLHVKIANRRKEWHWKVAKILTEKYGMIYHEDLKIKNMTASAAPKQNMETGGFEKNGASAQGGRAKSILDMAWGAFFLRLNSSAESRGGRIMAVNPNSTSQTCSKCGLILAEKIKLDQRTFECENKKCGNVQDRDHNAAVNILNRGIEAFTAMQEAARLKAPISAPA